MGVQKQINVKKKNMKDRIVILKGSLIENIKWHQELCQTVGPEDPKSIRQMEECNKIKQLMREYGE